MLKQENSKKYGNILLTQQTLIGSDPECDIVIKCSGVRPKHALIKYSKKTSSFWLKQLMPTVEKEINNNNSTREQKEEEIKSKNNEKILNDGSLIELKPLDKLLFGNGSDYIEFTFINKDNKKQKLLKRSNSCCNLERKKTLKEQNEFSLPIVGNKIKPKPYINKFVRPIQNNIKLCQLQQQQNNNNKQIQNNEITKTTFRRRSISSSTSKIIKNNKTESENDSDKNENIQNQNLKETQLQKIKSVKLLDSANSFQEALVRANEENEQLRSELLLQNNNKKVISTNKLNEIVYETFFKICNGEMDILNKRISNMSVRDYSDIFSEINKILHEPFSFRLMEINSKCSVIFESLKLKPLEKEELYIQLDNFLKEKIYPISKAVDSFLGTLRESALIAKESARACSVFSQWSREFGDQLQLNPDWNLMIYKVRDLQNRFKEQGLPRHWLIPSLMPILEILIFERKNWIDERQKRECQMAETLKKTNEKIKELEEKLEKRPLAGIPQIEVNQTDPLNKLFNGIIQKEIKVRANSIPLIQLPISNESPTTIKKENDEANLPKGQRSPREEKKESTQSPKKPLSPRTPRSARSSRGSFKLTSYASEDYESSKQHSPLQETHLDSPHTPPPSHRIPSVLGIKSIPPIFELMVEATKTAKERGESQDNEEEDEEDEIPWGDKLPESLKEEENILNKENNNERENYQIILNSVEQNSIEEIPKECLNENLEDNNFDEFTNLINKETINESISKKYEENDQKIEKKEENNFKFNNSNKLINLEEKDFSKILNNSENRENNNNEMIDQEEFEKIKKEILQIKNNKNITQNQEKSNKTNFSIFLTSKVPSYKTFEFWGLAHSLANILNIELPSRDTINYQNYNYSLSRPQSAGEFDARQKAVDSIQGRLKSMMNELRRVQNEI